MAIPSTTPEHAASASRSVSAFVTSEHAPGEHEKRRSMTLFITERGDSITVDLSTQPPYVRPEETIIAGPDHPLHPYLAQLVARLHDRSV